MPEYLAPDVYIEEVSFRAHAIEGVGTSVAALVGPTRIGPTAGTPEPLTSYADYRRIYGDEADLQFGDSTSPRPNHSALAARAFFDNGGKQLYVVRVFNGDEAASQARAEAVSKAIVFQARFPGAAGNLTLDIHWRDLASLLRRRTAAGPLGAGATLFLEAGNVPKGALTGNTGVPDGGFPLGRLRATVQEDGGALKIIGAELIDKNGARHVLTSDQGVTLDDNELTPTSPVWRDIVARRGDDSVPDDGTHVLLAFAAPTDLRPFIGSNPGDNPWGEAIVLHGTLQSNGTRLHIDAARNKSVTSDLDFDLAALAATPTGVSLYEHPRALDLDVLDDQGEVLFSAAGIALAANTPDALDQRLPAEPRRRQDRLTQPVAATLSPADATDAEKTRTELFDALWSLFDDDALQHPDPLLGPRYLIRLTGGSDGLEPQPRDYAGEVDERNGSRGLAALEGVEDVSIVLTPAAAASARDIHQAVVLEVQKHCRRLRYRIGLVDSRHGQTLAEVQALRDQFSDDRLALYYPWVVISDPRPGGDGGPLAVPPSGFLAGILARTDVERGVHKAPANTPVLGALDLDQHINRFQQELLNPRGINCLRRFPGRGMRVWGARTLSGDPQWKFLNVRRYFLFLERSIYKGTQWAVFEPNGERLWASVRSSVEDFLFNEWRAGHLLGDSPRQAYFVRCDRSTMTQNDIDNGRLVCEVGVAPLTPAEFVVFRIGQKTADA